MTRTAPRRVSAAPFIRGASRSNIAFRSTAGPATDSDRGTVARCALVARSSGGQVRGNASLGEGERRSRSLFLPRQWLFRARWIAAQRDVEVAQLRAARLNDDLEGLELVPRGDDRGGVRPARGRNCRAHVHAGRDDAHRSAAGDERRVPRRVATAHATAEQRYEGEGDCCRAGPSHVVPPELESVAMRRRRSTALRRRRRRRCAAARSFLRP